MLKPGGVCIDGAINGFSFWLLGGWEEAAGAALQHQYKAGMGTDAEVKMHIQRDANSLAQAITNRGAVVVFFMKTITKASHAVLDQRDLKD